MTSSTLDRHRPQLRAGTRWRLPHTVTGAVIAVAVIRALSLHAAPAPDEGGFLMVAAQWTHGPSLYGHYWVDRPPLLIGLFGLADLGGGLVALRVLGILASVLALVLLAATSRRLFGRRAAAWTAVVTAALLCSPVFGSREVNGELLALPFVALGLRAAVEAVLAEDPYVARAAALLAGAATAASLMVKQNIADVAVFAVVAWCVAGRRKVLRGRRAIELIVLAACGGAAALTVILLFAMSRGTSPLALYQALYPFRLHAGELLAAAPQAPRLDRAAALAGALLLTGAPAVMLAFAWFGVRRSRAPWFVWGVIAMAVYDVASMAGGGSFWLHYEVELLPALALMAGAVSLRAPVVMRAVAALMVASALVVTAGRVVGGQIGDQARGQTGGSAVAAAITPAARPGDTIISAFGDADIPWLTGMSSPYPYLWSLPSRVLDPGMALLRGVLSGPSAPTWVVVRGPGTAGRLADANVLGLIHQRYHQVAVVDGRHIYLLDGVDRPGVAA